MSNKNERPFFYNGNVASATSTPAPIKGRVSMPWLAKKMRNNAPVIRTKRTIIDAIHSLERTDPNKFAELIAELQHEYGNLIHSTKEKR